jgi:hypothetical protein
LRAATLTKTARQVFQAAVRSGDPGGRIRPQEFVNMPDGITFNVPKPAHHQFRDLEGMVFGDIKVGSYMGKGHFAHIWECQCSCGKVYSITANVLTSGNTKSCGCKRGRNISAGKIRHGHAFAGDRRTTEYTTWASIKARCRNQNNKEFKNYGGRGVLMCERWASSFEAFFADMGPKPTPKHSIDRIDHNGHYEPGNVRWATPSEQARNRRANRLITVDGETKTLAEWSEISGNYYSVITSRINRGVEPKMAVFAKGLVRTYRNGQAKVFEQPARRSSARAAEPA